jgi:hypothetical protein
MWRVGIMPVSTCWMVGEKGDDDDDDDDDDALCVSFVLLNAHLVS